MKNIFKIFVLLFVIGIMSSCEPDKYPKPDIDLTPVYNISETGNNGMTEINIYKEINLFVSWNKDGAVTAVETKDYVDASDDLNYNVTYATEVMESNTVEEDVDENTVASTVSDVTTITNYELTGVIADETAQLAMNSTITTVSTTTLIITDENGNVTEQPQDPVITTETSESTVNGMIMDKEVYN